MKRTDAQTVIEKLKEAVYFQFAINQKSTTADLFTEMLNGTRNVKSVMDILFITIEIEADIDVQAVRVQSQSVKEI